MRARHLRRLREAAHPHAPRRLVIPLRKGPLGSLPQFGSRPGVLHQIRGGGPVIQNDECPGRVDPGFRPSAVAVEDRPHVL